MQVLNFDFGIDFGASGNLPEFSPIGFSPIPDDVSTWSEAPVAELAFRLPPLRYDVRFTIEVFPFLIEDLLLKQDCWVFFNGLFAHYQSIKTPVELIFTIGRELLSPRTNRLSFVMPNATSPKDLKIGDDLRMLGLAFVKLSAGDAAAAASVARRETGSAEIGPTTAANSIIPALARAGAPVARLAPALGLAARRILTQPAARDNADRGEPEASKNRDS